jgi:hypothetical protein
LGWWSSYATATSAGGRRAGLWFARALRRRFAANAAARHLRYGRLRRKELSSDLDHLKLAIPDRTIMDSHKIGRQVIPENNPVVARLTSGRTLEWVLDTICVRLMK